MRTAWLDYIFIRAPIYPEGRIKICRKQRRTRPARGQQEDFRGGALLISLKVVKRGARNYSSPKLAPLIEEKVWIAPQ